MPSPIAPKRKPTAVSRRGDLWEFSKRIMARVSHP